MDRLLFNHSSYFDDFSIIGITSVTVQLIFFLVMRLNITTATSCDSLILILVTQFSLKLFVELVKIFYFMQHTIAILQTQSKKYTREAINS